MAFSKPLTHDERISIIEGYKMKLSPARIAENLGRSTRVVQKVISEEVTKKKEEPKNQTISVSSKTAQPKKYNDKSAQNTIERLRETRDILHNHMLSADSRNIASITKEYRTVCEEIERIEKTVGKSQKQSDDPILSRLKVI